MAALEHAEKENKGVLFPTLWIHRTGAVEIEILSKISPFIQTNSVDNHRRNHVAGFGLVAFIVVIVVLVAFCPEVSPLLQQLTCAYM